MGPATRAPVRLTVSAMSRADWSMTRWSKAFSRMRMRCPAIERTILQLWLLSSGRRLLGRSVQNCGQDAIGNLLERQRLHRVRRAALRQRTNRRRIAEHFRERHFAVHNRLPEL